MAPFPRTEPPVSTTVSIAVHDAGWIHDPAGKDIVLQMTTLSDRIQASVWVDGDLSTKESFEIAVAARDPGSFGLAFGAGTDEATGMAPDVTVPFNEFSIVPEPSTASLVALGMLGLSGFRRLRPLG